ncbi:MAG: hypothetical protein HDR18_05355 [Lachnospiraceae bacterium]|nr:hypothetical protein [Lachnospiraceae bacterium]
MNRLNWIQQEQKIADYHVLKWPTSHFHHPRNRTDIVAQAGGKFEMSGGAASQGAQQPEGIGQGLSDPARDIVWRAGGLGTDGMAEDGRKDAVHSEIMNTADRTKGRQITGASQSVETTQAMAAAQTIVPEEVYSVLGSARQSVLKLHDRVKQSTAKLRDHYQKQQKQMGHATVSKVVKRGSQQKEKRGTRKCDKEDVLSMQAQNHYLLDSYDKNGQYSMLGK